MSNLDRRGRISGEARSAGPTRVRDHAYSPHDSPGTREDQAVGHSGQGEAACLAGWGPGCGCCRDRPLQRRWHSAIQASTLEESVGRRSAASPWPYQATPGSKVTPLVGRSGIPVTAVPAPRGGAMSSTPTSSPAPAPPDLTSPRRGDGLALPSPPTLGRTERTKMQLQKVRDTHYRLFAAVRAARRWVGSLVGDRPHGKTPPPGNWIPNSDDDGGQVISSGRPGGH